MEDFCVCHNYTQRDVGFQTLRFEKIRGKSCSFVIDVYVNVWYFHNLFRFVFVFCVLGGKNTPEKRAGKPTSSCEGTPTGNVISGQNAWKKGGNPQLPVAHAHTREVGFPALFSGVFFSFFIFFFKYGKIKSFYSVTQVTLDFKRCGLKKYVGKVAVLS
jgi:hypothetical protein